mgnify:CR=1 FL=1|tara:strand:+ start:123 stop:476 length:354 start_codon:yes stop_codon:yes gene_type:complete
MSKTFSTDHIARILETAAVRLQHGYSRVGVRAAERDEILDLALKAVDEVEGKMMALRGGYLGTGNEATGSAMAYLCVAERAGYGVEDAGMCGTTARVQAETMSAAMLSAANVLRTLA